MDNCSIQNRKGHLSSRNTKRKARKVTDLAMCMRKTKVLSKNYGRNISQVDLTYTAVGTPSMMHV